MSSKRNDVGQEVTEKKIGHPERCFIAFDENMERDLLLSKLENFNLIYSLLP